jgi:hypothetical protein
MQKFTKTLATSLTALVFLVVGLTGVFMYFHLFEQYTKDLHEILGLLFVLTALLHVVFNFKAMKQYFSNKIFIASSIAILAISSVFILNTNSDAPNPKKAIIVSVLNAPLEKAVQILGSDMDTLKVVLENNNLNFNKELSISQLAKANETSPFALIQDLLSQKSLTDG